MRGSSAAEVNSAADGPLERGVSSSLKTSGEVPGHTIAPICLDVRRELHLEWVVVRDSSLGLRTGGLIPMPRYRITISSRSGQAMTDLIRKHKIQVLDHGARGNKEAGFAVDAIVEEPDIQRLRDAGYTVQQHEDVDATGRERQKEVGQGNRYTDHKPN